MNDKRYGQGKEYYNGKSPFEGEYLYNFKLKGKFYINKKLEYEVEYLFNKKYNRKGLDKNGNGNIIYELNNENGKFKEYDFHCKLILDGAYL